ncbi:MAG: cache domain-containing protein [Aliarcobacter sp.]|nr:cache domain-containing protein [Aliarcobacter sp.]
MKEEINQAYFVLEAIYNENIKDPNYSKEKTLKLFKESLKKMRFNDDMGYMFIYELDGTNILNSQFPELEGKNLWNYKDSKGTLLLQEMKKILSSRNETYYTWYWKKTNDKDAKEYEKLGYFRKFEPYNIFIGTGDYVEDFQEKLQKKVLNKLNSLKFKEPEHIFIYDEKGLCLVNPKKELIGVNRYDSKNSEGIYVLRELLDFTFKNKEGFTRYKGSVILNKENVTNDKISFVKLVEDWNWMIGTGFYLEELYNEIDNKKISLEELNKESIHKIIELSLIITIIMVLLSFYLSNLISSIFRKYKIEIKNEIENSLEKEKLLVQQSKMATMGEMIGNIAHQWKQPLSVILMSNSLIKINQENKDFSTQSEINEAIENVDNSVKHLSQTIDDFRDFFKPEKEKSDFTLEYIFNKTYKLISSQFRNNNIEIFKTIDNVSFYGYPNELLQVLINIIKNAKDALIQRETPRLIFINIYEENNKVIIKIKDNAGGINEKIIDKIFDAYFTTKHNNEGTGIGLYMSQQIIEGMNGKIDVSNVNYQYEDRNYTGAEFTISLNQQEKNL